MIHQQLYIDKSLPQSADLFHDLKIKKWHTHYYYIVVCLNSPFQCECINSREMARIDTLTKDYFIVGLLSEKKQFRTYSLWIANKVYIEKKALDIREYYLKGDTQNP